VARLREAVLKVLAEEPEAVVLDLGGVEAVEEEPSLVMFSTLGRLVADRAESELVLAAPSLRLRVALQRASSPLFVRVFATRAEAWLAAEQGVARRRVRECLPATPYAPRFARRIVDEVCARWHLAGDVRERAELIVTELVTNAVQHAGGGAIELIVAVRRPMLRVEVGDDHQVLPYRPQASPGRGLQLVDKLASHWGSRPTHRGKVVWADLMISPQRRELTEAIGSDLGAE
ncbi:MAG TPA: ATP-binding protein, partial [Pseudonocardiaceae bacterium]|nr:ATP-binding protein [Pseudonocardiaceae bacterium]